MGLRTRSLFLFLAACLSLAAAPMGQGTPPVPTPSGTSAPGNPASPSDSLKSAAADSSYRPKSRADTVLVVKHRFNHREQIITGSVVMSCLALMMVVMNNYNPR
jgi:hypothetical protein